MNLLDFIYYLGALTFLWAGSGIIISAIDGFSRRLKLSPFSVSFFFLGILTSLPEFAVGFTSLGQKRPEIFVGNLLGGINVIFLFVIPILALLGKGIKLTKQIDNSLLLLASIVVAAPSFLVLDRKVTNPEAAILILLYIILFLFIERRRGFLDSHNGMGLDFRAYSPMDVLKVLFGMVVVLISSRYVVERTIFLANELQVSSLVLSMIILSLGTNLPELSLAVRAIITKRGEIALGDYLGSASANTLIFGILSLVNNGEIFTNNGFHTNFYFTVAGLAAFYFFAQSERKISRTEGIALLLVYIAFAGLELAA